MVFRRHGRRHRGDSLLCTRCRPASCDVVEPTRWRPAASDPCGTAVGTPDGSEFLARGDPCGWIVFQAGHDPLLVIPSWSTRGSVARTPSKQWQGLATRYDKTATIYLAALALAGISVRSAT